MVTGPSDDHEALDGRCDVALAERTGRAVRPPATTRVGLDGTAPVTAAPTCAVRS